MPFINSPNLSEPHQYLIELSFYNLFLSVRGIVVNTYIFTELRGLFIPAVPPDHAVQKIAYLDDCAQEPIARPNVPACEQLFEHRSKITLVPRPVYGLLQHPALQ